MGLSGEDVSVEVSSGEEDSSAEISGGSTIGESSSGVFWSVGWIFSVSAVMGDTSGYYFQQDNVNMFLITVNLCNERS